MKSRVERGGVLCRTNRSPPEEQTVSEGFPHLPTKRVESLRGACDYRYEAFFPDTGQYLGRDDNLMTINVKYDIGGFLH